MYSSTCTVWLRARERRDANATELWSRGEVSFCSTLHCTRLRGYNTIVRNLPFGRRVASGLAAGSEASSRDRRESRNHALESRFCLHPISGIKKA
jgi:hypothetical protein